MPVRSNIVTNAAAKQKYVQAVLALKQQFTGTGLSPGTAPSWELRIPDQSFRRGIA